MLERLRYVEFRGGVPRAQRAAGHVEYRIGYYIVSRSDKWWWGESAPFIPQADLLPLIDEATSEGTILNPES